MKVLRVFINENGEYGNPVGVIVDEKRTITRQERQKMAMKSGFSEIVFIDNVWEKQIHIFTPKREIPFAGHAAVGVTYYLTHKYQVSVKELKGIGGIIETWEKEGLTWVKCELAILPDWNYERLPSPEDVEELDVNKMSDKKHLISWAWVDEVRGVVRARTFAPDWGIPEDEANGSGAMRLASNLGRELTVLHGKGSVIHAKPSSVSGKVEVGGKVLISK